MKAFTSLMVLAMALTACGVSTADHPAGPPAGAAHFFPAEKPVNDTSVCNFGTPARSLVGSWNADFAFKGVSLNMTFQFRNGALTLVNRCEFDNGRSLSAQVSAPYTSSSTSFTVLNDSYDNQKIDEPGFNANCDVSISRASLDYSFSGSCLVMRDPSGQTLTLVPASY
jgi:hypothetical protein